MVVKVALMNLEQHIHVDTNFPPDAVRLMLVEGKVKVAMREPEQVMEEIWTRATEIGSVLEGILHEPHSKGHWYEHPTR
jgi:hypothetical protein